MTQISPRHAADLSDRHARARHQAAMARLRTQITEGSYIVALILMAAAAGYLAHMPPTCTDTVQIDFD